MDTHWRMPFKCELHKSDYFYHYLLKSCLVKLKMGSKTIIKWLKQIRLAQVAQLIKVERAIQKSYCHI